MKNLHFKMLLVFIFSGFISVAAIQNPRKAEATIKSTVECIFCKKNIEDKLSKMKGVRKVTADYEKHEIRIVYNSKHVSLDEIKKAITDMGYDADDVKANNKMTQLLQHK